VWINPAYTKCYNNTRGSFPGSIFTTWSQNNTFYIFIRGQEILVDLLVFHWAQLWGLDKALYSGFPPFKASQFQAHFKTFSRLNYLEIKTQLIRFGQILTKHQVAAGKPTKEFGMMCLRLLNDHSGTFFNKMAIFQTLFPDFIREITKFQTFSRTLNFFTEFQNFSRPWEPCVLKEIGLFYRLLDSLRGTASCRPILLCLRCLEDNCSVIWCVFCWWKGIGPTKSMHRHCCAYITYTEPLRQTCWQAPPLPRSCEFLNSVACARAMTSARWWGWQFTSSFMLFHSLTFVILCGSEFSSILQNGALCFFEKFSC
jgi:hypothetical protein